MPSYRVIIEWKDNDVEDADEMQVIARSPRTAITSARKKWDAKNRKKCPNCRATCLWILTEKERGFALASQEFKRLYEVNVRSY